MQNKFVEIGDSTRGERKKFADWFMAQKMCRNCGPSGAPTGIALRLVCSLAIRVSHSCGQLLSLDSNDRNTGRQSPSIKNSFGGSKMHVNIRKQETPKKWFKKFCLDKKLFSSFLFNFFLLSDLF